MRCPECGKIIDGLVTYGGVAKRPHHIEDHCDWFYCPHCENENPRDVHDKITNDPDVAREILDPFVIEVEKKLEDE